MNKDHIVILKKIPVDPKHVEALRLRRDVPERIGEEESHHTSRHMHHEVEDETPTPMVYRIFSSVLFVAFLVNPIGVAYAAEVDIIPDAPAEEVASDTPAQEEVMPPKGVTIVIPPSEDGAGAPSTPEATSTDDGTVPPGDGETGTTTATSTDPLLDESGTTTASTTDDGTGGTPSDEEDTATSTDETASTTEEVIEEREAETRTNLDREQTPEERAAERVVAEAAMREQIKKEVEAEMRSRCVSYGGDGYYCLDENSEDRVTNHAPVEQVIVSREGGGDKEIVLVRSLPEGETRTAVTENDVDDDFPNADGEMRMIVWQSLMDGRWQIAYKEGTGTVEYLTANKDGNGHPATDGKRIVWQAWSGDHWDIFLAEPGNTERPFGEEGSAVLQGIHPGWKVTQLSHNSSHDMFPKIAGNFVTWQEHRGEEWVIVVYDLSTGQTRTVEGEAGGTGEAPTVALIYKERTKEGRIFIRASDLATGERIPLRDDELPQPAKLPIPEQDGALPIQNGTSSVSTMRLEGEGDGGTPVI